jgi:glycolate oxidase iron-sulfur subunit
MTRDVSEVLAAEQRAPARVAAPDRRRQRRAGGLSTRPARCSTHRRFAGSSRALLDAAGYQLSPVADAHLCCGSAGTYSISQPVLATQLRDNKLAAMNAGSPALLVTANIGCQTHLQSGSRMPVRHWIELIDERLRVAS